MSKNDQTPLMKQYWEIKSLHQDKILLFRMGDFYEMFFDDAIKAAPILGIALTQRNKKSSDETPMCGMPHHSVAGPINKLLSFGLKVAICDQVEDPKLAKGIVKRAVTRVLTPGMVYDSDTLEGTQAHYIAAVDLTSLAVVDTTTGEALLFRDEHFQNLQKLVEVLPIVEVVIAPELQNLVTSFSGKLISEHQDLYTAKHEVFRLLHQTSITTAQRLISYIVQLSGEEKLKTISAFQERSLQHRMELSSTVLRHLEIFQNYKGEGQGTLFYSINRTQTSNGARLLRQWLSFPLRNLDEILDRQNHVRFWTQHLVELKRLRQVLAQMGDIERRLGKISQPQCHGRDLLALAHSVHAGLSAVGIAAQTQVSTKQIESLRQLAYEIEQTLVEDPPLTTKQGYLIRQGVHATLDEYMMLTTDSQKLLQDLEARERESTGVSSLKIRYNNVFGYYIEVTNTHKDKVPATYQRKQTLANAERYCTDELIELEKKVLSAQSKRADLEFEIFEKLRQKTINNASELLTLASECSRLDVLSSLAWLSIEQKYVQPNLKSHGDVILKSNRHPVVEQNVKAQFIANDIQLLKESCILLTGPNMAGKSTIMRQVALTAIMAQIGSSVPADSADLPIFDAIYTRIGASDQLSEGLSTFMVEMTETAAMLKKATAQSLVILDEVGRGTSTFDGMCLAQSILEHLMAEKKCYSLFATHYHELTSLCESFPRIQNAHMSVTERNGQIQFLHTLVRGPAMKSYGIQVAELAGLPMAVTKRAKSLLRDLEKNQHQASSQLSLMDLTEDTLPLHYSSSQNESLNESISSTKVVDTTEQQLEIQFRLPNHLEMIFTEMKAYPLMEKSPIEVMNQMAKWKIDIEKSESY